MSKAEKFIQDYTRNCSNLMQVPTLDDKGNIVPEAHPWLTPDQARRAVEIARDAFIEKACEYWYQYNRNIVKKHGSKAVLGCSEFTVNVEDFKKYIEE